MNAAAPRSRPNAPVDFGFRRVDPDEKDRLVRGVFDRVAGRYDLMNDLMSLGAHRLWKEALLDWLAPRPSMSLVDIGGGTGDVAFRFRARGGGPAVVVDVNESMLSTGRRRAAGRRQGDGLQWLLGDAEALPVADGAVDAVTAAFSLRNVTRVERALAEARRVLRPGGRFLCLEFARLALPLLAPAYDAYSFRVLPALGRAVAGDGAAYRYLAESIRRFPDQERFAALIGDAGLERVRVRNLAGGIAALYSAWRL